MAKQSLLAVDEADVVLFLVDARDGVTVGDQAIATHLRKQNKKVYLVCNKIDGIDATSAMADFYSLSLGELYGIAAAHGRGVEQLLTTCFKPLADDYPDVIASTKEDSEDLEHDEIDYEALPLKLAIVGRPNVGKSTLTNRILGEERVVVYDMPGTTRDSVYIPMQRDEREYILIDTAGVRRRGRIGEAIEKFSVVKTLQAIEDANVVLVVIDARETITDQDLNLIGFALNAGVPL